MIKKILTIALCTVASMLMLTGCAELVKTEPSYPVLDVQLIKKIDLKDLKRKKELRND